MNAVITTEIVLDNLRSEKHAAQFISLPNQRQALLTLATNFIKDGDEAQDEAQCKGYKHARIL